MITVRKSEDRGAVHIDWLNSKHSFSFGEYHDPAHMGFGPLRVINEDTVAGGGGFPPHAHRDMEIVTYVLDGALEHQDSLGNKGVIRPGEIQRMSAGKGIRHAEFNASADEACHFLQIWIMPSENGIAPSYEQKTIDRAAAKNAFVRIAAPQPKAEEVRLMQDAEIWTAHLDTGTEAMHATKSNRGLWLQVARGAVEIDGQALKTGDGAAISGQDSVRVRATAPSEVLLFDMG